MKDDIMHSTLTVAGTLFVLFLSTFTRSALGFGDALVAMPFLAILLGMQTATPLVALVSTLISLVILVRHWRIVDFRMAWRLIITAACGVPVGLLYLTRVPESITQVVLGLLLIGFCLYNLRPSSEFKMRVSPHTAYAFGFASGILGGAYNTVGPMLVVYGHLRGWPPEQFRATLQSCFFPAYGSIVIGHLLAGLVNREIVQYFVLSLPFICLAIYLGGRLHTCISQQHFTRYVNLALLLIGIFLCIQGYMGRAEAKGQANPHLIQSMQVLKQTTGQGGASLALALVWPHAISCVATCPDFRMSQGEHDAADSAPYPQFTLNPTLARHFNPLLG
jgi:uncharacterized membrane protein YfcA